MKFKDFLEESGIKPSFVAKKIGSTRQQIYDWKDGKYSPQLHFIDAIDTFSNGKVKFKDWLIDRSDPKSQ